MVNSAVLMCYVSAKLQIESYSSDVRAFKRTVREAAFSQRIKRLLLTLGLWPRVSYAELSARAWCCTAQFIFANLAIPE